MMFAIQNGLQINAVERLKWLFEALPSKSKKVKERLDSLFNVLDKMKLLTDTTEQLAGKVCMIPCIYWLHSKAILSREAPLFLKKRLINLQRVISANNIFGNLIKMQSMPYEKILAPEEIRWYFIRLENENLKADDEKLREVSNSVLTEGARSGYIPLQEPIAWGQVFVNSRQPSERPAKKKLSLPVRLSFSSTQPRDEPLIKSTIKKKSDSAPTILSDDLK